MVGGLSVVFLFFPSFPYPLFPSLGFTVAPSCRQETHDCCERRFDDAGSLAERVSRPISSACKCALSSVTVGDYVVPRSTRCGASSPERPSAPPSPDWQSPTQCSGLTCQGTLGRVSWHGSLHVIGESGGIATADMAMLPEHCRFSNDVNRSNPTRPSGRHQMIHFLPALQFPEMRHYQVPA